MLKTTEPVGARGAVERGLLLQEGGLAFCVGLTCELLTSARPHLLSLRPCSAHTSFCEGQMGCCSSSGTMREGELG